MRRAGNAAGGQLRACSGCAGDYEDPEGTAWSEVDEEEGADDASVQGATQPGPRERFPVPQE